MNLTTPQEVFNHIISIYEKCETLDEIKIKTSYFICNAIKRLAIDYDLKDLCIEIIESNYDLVQSDLRLKYVLLDKSKAIRENRQKEYIQIKIDYLNKLIELCDKSSN